MASSCLGIDDFLAQARCGRCFCRAPIDTVDIVAFVLDEVVLKTRLDRWKWKGGYGTTYGEFSDFGIIDTIDLSLLRSAQA